MYGPLITLVLERVPWLSIRSYFPLIRLIFRVWDAWCMWSETDGTKPLYFINFKNNIFQVKKKRKTSKTRGKSSISKQWVKGDPIRKGLMVMGNVRYDDEFKFSPSPYTGRVRGLLVRSLWAQEWSLTGFCFLAN